jgi:hypothetical protein
MKKQNKVMIAVMVGILILAGTALSFWLLRCPSEIYTTIGNFESREAGLREAVPKLATEIHRCPEAELYRIVWIGPDPNRHALLYDAKRNRLGYEDDVLSGIAGKTYIVDKAAINKVAERRETLEDFSEYDQSRR